MIIGQFILIGVLAGVCAGMFGVGGGLVIVPFLIYLSGFSIHTAMGTSLGALLFPVGLLGALEYYKAGHIEIKASIIIAIGLFVGAYFGAKLVQPISPLTLRRLYAVFLLVVAGKMILGK